MSSSAQVGLQPGGQRASDLAYERLGDLVRRGVFSQNSRLPAERTLSAQLGVSRATLRNALSRLADEGLVESVVGSGWYVAPDVVGEPPSVLQSFTDMARTRGLRPTSTIIGSRTRPATLSEAERLKTAPGAAVFVLSRLRGMDQTVICLDEAIMPLPAVQPLLEVDLTDRSLYQELERTCGLRVFRSAYSVQAEVADEWLAGELGVAVGWPILTGREIGHVESGAPILLGLSRYRGDAYRFQADLYRPRERGED